jgi:hypothetical protein
MTFDAKRCGCGAPIPYLGRGRPRKRCPACRLGLGDWCAALVQAATADMPDAKRREILRIVFDELDAFLTRP